MNRKLNDEIDKAVVNQETEADMCRGEKFPGVEARLKRRLSFPGNFIALADKPVRGKGV